MSLNQVLLSYLQVKDTSTCAVSLWFRYVAVQVYCPESFAVAFEMTREADSVLLRRWVPWAEDLVHMITAGGKLSRLQVRFRSLPFWKVVFPMIWSFLLSVEDRFSLHFVSIFNHPSIHPSMVFLPISLCRDEGHLMVFHSFYGARGFYLGQVAGPSQSHMVTNKTTIHSLIHTCRFTNQPNMHVFIYCEEDVRSTQVHSILFLLFFSVWDFSHRQGFLW